MTGRPNGAFTPGVVELIVTRDRGMCAWCGGVVTGARGSGWSIHHRRPRGMGGSRKLWIGQAANGVVVHGHGTVGCHHRIEANRERATAAGFLIPMGVATAENTVINHAVLGRVLLQNDGSYVRAREQREEWTA